MKTIIRKSIKNCLLLFLCGIFFATTITVHAQSGTAGPLTWNISGGTLTISGNGAMPNYLSILLRAPWYSHRNSINAVVIENGVTSIGNFAFNGLNMMTAATIGNSVQTIGGSAFAGCTGLSKITNHAATPQTINANVFTGVNLSIGTLYVPNASLSAYQNAPVWMNFSTIKTWALRALFIYDAAGNRTQRNVIILQNTTSQSLTKSATTNDSSHPETRAATFEMPPFFDDMPGERKVIIYPNPTQGMLRIEFQGYDDMRSIRLFLFDLQGRALQQVTGVNPSHTLDMTSYPSGMYILQIIDDNARSEWKIVKE